MRTSLSIAAALAAGCFTEPADGTAPPTEACVDFIIDDPLMTLDPPDAFPQQDTSIGWFNRYVLRPANGEEPVFDEVEETITLRHGASGVLLAQITRPALKPERSAQAGGRESSIDLSDLAADVLSFDPFQNYTVDVRLDEPAGAGVQCTDNGWGEASLELALPCTCDGHFRYDLRVDGGGTSPADPTEGLAFDFVWIESYDFVGCVEAYPQDSGEFEVTFTITTPTGSHELVLARPLLLPGEERAVSLPIMEIANVPPIAGNYQVDLSLDAAGDVYECEANGTVSTTNQITSFSFTIGPPV